VARLFMLLFSLSAFSQPWDSMTIFPSGSFTSGGHSWADIDGDGDVDLFISVSNDFRLFINQVDVDGSFLAAPAELVDFTPNSNGISAAFGDVDNDGDPDIHFGQRITDYLLINNWPDPFTNVAPALEITDEEFPQSIGWVDYNLDGLLDLYITHEFPGTIEGAHRFFESAWPDPFIPRFPQTPGEIDTFGLADLNSHAYGLSWGDIDLDGDMDAVTSACGTADVLPGENPHNKVYRNDFPLQGFTDVSMAAGLLDAAEVTAGSQSYWATLFDHDNDGRPDLSIGDADFSGAGDHRMWRNTTTTADDISFTSIPAEIHGIVDSNGYLHSACAGDVDNDGDLDLYTTTEGLYLNNGDGSFTNRSDLVDNSYYDASFVDFDNDGDLDIFNFTKVYINPGNENHWIAIELVGEPSEGSTRSAHGAKIRVRAGGMDYYREHRFMVGTYSQHMLPTHFGLGDATLIDEIEVTWLGGGTPTLLEDVAVDQYITIRQNPCFQAVRLDGPDTVSACVGETVNLSISAELAGPVDFQWRKDGAPLSGETDPALSFAMGVGMVGSYDCVVTHPLCEITSDPIDLSLAEAPVIVLNPTDLVVFEGDMAQLTMSTVSPASYQWYRNGMPVAGATDAVFSRGTVGLEDIGTYVCAADDGCIEPTLTDSARLCVIADQLFTDIGNWSGGNLLDLLEPLQNACPPPP